MGDISCPRATADLHFTKNNLQGISGYSCLAMVEVHHLWMLLTEMMWSLCKPSCTFRINMSLPGIQTKVVLQLPYILQLNCSMACRIQKKRHWRNILLIWLSKTMQRSFWIFQRYRPRFCRTQWSTRRLWLLMWPNMPAKENLLPLPIRTLCKKPSVICKTQM